ncbi:hypothetical protein [Hydrogenophaga sp.]|uniref:hypothetical protein n=1 Tax=Hydrogenophaga sp. TaxID=1904254 RepID=UPI002621A6E7|nr:hypothetical protein [Hydrogenophaga sp.]MCW5655751.1 hypothetical protein [Hydrogenophaga sp.]
MGYSFVQRWQRRLLILLLLAAGAAFLWRGGVSLNLLTAIGLTNLSAAAAVLLVRSSSLVRWVGVMASLVNLYGAWVWFVLWAVRLR